MHEINRTVFAIAALAAVTASLMLPVEGFAATDESIEEIVVTGSRIRRLDYNSSAPTTVVSGQSLLESGLSNLGEALRNQPIIGTGGFNQSSILSGGGATSIDLRNLGPDRVLILVNGRRVASFADDLANQAADLTFIPTAMVERVEILRDGSSAIYGSDAITGVVNIILKSDFEGAELNFNSGTSGEHDGDSHGVAMTMGINRDRGNLVFGAEFRDHQPVKQVDRDWSFPSISSLSKLGFNHGSFFSPGGVFIGDQGGLFCTRSKALGGDEVTDVSDTLGCESNTSPVSRDDVTRYDYGLIQDLVIGSQAIAISGYGNYHLRDNINVFLETQFGRRTSVSQLDANPGSFGTVVFPDGSRVPASNPNNPTGEDGIFLFRPSSTIGPRKSFHESNTTRIVVGMEGEIPESIWFKEMWNFELSVLYSSVDADLRTKSTWNLARFIRISDPDACIADDLCAQAVNVSGALDTLRPGNWTRAEIEYLRQNTIAVSEFRTYGWSAVVLGPMFELPAGVIGVAAGLEFRNEDGLNKPDPTTEAGESVANAIFTTEGEFDLLEFFVELDVPLLTDKPLAKNLSLNLQYRRSDYSNFGSAGVYRIGFNWQVNSGVRLRGNTSTAHRTPTITDLFGGGTISFDGFDDVCQGASGNAVINCAMDGLDTDFIQISSQYPVLAGSNAKLEPEKADTWTLGIVFSPGWLPGFLLSADMWNIEVENLISRDPSSQILRTCYEGPIGKTDPACDQFEGRNPQGIPVNFVNSLANLEGVQTDGFDLAANYSFEWFSGTSWNIDLIGTYVAENTFYPEAGGASAGGSFPRVIANVNTTVVWNDWTLSWYARYISSMDDSGFTGLSTDGVDLSDNPFRYSGPESYTKHDLRLAYEWEKYRVLVGVNNVLDDDPPYVFSPGNNADAKLYDVIGQYWFVRFDVNLW